MKVLAKFSSFYTDLASMKIDDLSLIYSLDVLFIDPISQHRGLAAIEIYFAKLLENIKDCHFVIHSQQTCDNGQCIVNWTMKFKTAKMKQGKPITVDGITMLKLENDKITFQRDYYDLGQMVYENIPLLGIIIKKIRRSMA
ncbi:MAG: limonene-1,2-epoxide hydrolase [Glaciecola sp.]|jgi:limonene-1,2-epoxide hydrolase